MRAQDNYSIVALYVDEIEISPSYSNGLRLLARVSQASLGGNAEALLREIDYIPYLQVLRTIIDNKLMFLESIQRGDK